MKKELCRGTLIFGCLMVIFIIITMISSNEVTYSMAITFGTLFYHLAMRLAVGGAVEGIKHNRFDYTRKWFQPKSFEASFYKKLGVKSWKKWVPTYENDNFDIKKHSLEEIIMATCQAEVVHEIIVVLSFVPIIFSVWFHSLPVFIITSIAAACLDMIFVLLQRFNRPRLLKMLEKSKMK